MERDKRLAELKRELARRLDEQRVEYFGAVNPEWAAYATEYFWDDAQQGLRIQDLVRYGFLPGRSRVLDLAAGCGQLMQYGCRMGYDIWGLEPERWKLDLVREKFRLLGLHEAEKNCSREWGKRFLSRMTLSIA